MCCQRLAVTGPPEWGANLCGLEAIDRVMLFTLLGAGVAKLTNAAVVGQIDARYIGRRQRHRNIQAGRTTAAAAGASCSTGDSVTAVLVAAVAMLAAAATATADCFTCLCFCIAPNGSTTC